MGSSKRPKGKAAPSTPHRPPTARPSRSAHSTPPRSDSPPFTEKQDAAAVTADRAAASAALAAAATEAAAVAAAIIGTSPVSSILSADPIPPTQPAHGEVVETLYSHPSAKIISFSAGARNLSLDMSSSASRSRNNRRMTTSEDNIEPGTLPAFSQFERTIAVGPLCIYRAPGSVAFLSCGSALQPILPKSQSWCIDEESSKFILQIRRPQYWRIELPVGDGGENDERAQRLREVLDHTLQFEKTPCPFKRDFTVELPELPTTPLKKKPWTPVKRPEGESPLATPTPPDGLQRAKTWQPHRRTPSPPTPLQKSPAASPPRQFATPVPLSQPTEFSRREWADMLEQQKKAPEEFDENGRRVVPALIAEHERIISEVKAGEIEVTKAGTPWHNTNSHATPPSGRSSRRERAMSLASDGPFLRSGSAWPSIERKWGSEVGVDTDPSTADSSSPFNSLRSWLSQGRRLSVSSPPSSTTGSLFAFPNGPDGAAVPPSLSSLYEDARKVFSGDEPAPAPAPETPRFRHRATTSSLTVSNIAPLPPAANILTHRSGRPATRLAAARRIPGSIIYKVFEILLKPPSYLIVLMLRVAARIISGEWRGSAFGKTDTGESIPVHWDYTDVDDPLGYKAEISRRKAVNKLNVYTEADVDVYTDAEDTGDDEEESEDEEDEEEEEEDDPSFSPPPPSSQKSARVSKDRPSTKSNDTLSDSMGDRKVWTRRWAVD